VWKVFGRIGEDCFEIALVVLVILFSFASWLAIPVIVIPLTLIGTFAFVKAFGTINTLSVWSDFSHWAEEWLH